MPDRAKVVEAILDDDGKLTALVVEQEDHSTRRVDTVDKSVGATAQYFVQATGFTAAGGIEIKKGDFSTNPVFQTDPEKCFRQIISDWATSPGKSVLEVLEAGTYGVVITTALTQSSEHTTFSVQAPYDPDWNDGDGKIFQFGVTEPQPSKDGSSFLKLKKGAQIYVNFEMDVNVDSNVGLYITFYKLT